MELNDELLSAYLDDELEPVAREQVATMLAADAGARLRLERMQSADRALHAALPLAEPDHFTAAMAARITGRAARTSWLTVAPWAAAAAVSGLFVGFLIPRTGAPIATASDVGQLGTALIRQLENSPSGAAGAHSAAVVLTFQSGNASYCRVFQTAAPRPVGEGLACRSNGQWALVAWDGTSAPPSAQFRPAGASTVIDAAMDKLGGTQALGADEESAAIKSGWRVP